MLGIFQNLMLVQDIGKLSLMRKAPSYCVSTARLADISLIDYLLVYQMHLKFFSWKSQKLLKVSKEPQMLRMIS